jgi:uncharacterized protein (UPF0332 family)
MSPDTPKLLHKASRALHAAEVLLREEEFDFAAGRAYYAMFYVAQALLRERGMRFSKHSAVHAAYGLHFAKTAALDPKFHGWLLDAYDSRIQGDYGTDWEATAKRVQEMIDQGREFLAVARRHLGLGGEPQANAEPATPAVEERPGIE